MTARCQSNRPTLKPAFSSLDRVFLVPTADSWAVRSGSLVSAARGGLAGFQTSARNQVSALRYVVDCDFLDLTLCSPWIVLDYHCFQMFDSGDCPDRVPHCVDSSDRR